MVKRATTRVAFGKPLAQLGKNLEVISRARIDIEAMRLMVLKAAKAMDVLGNKEARVWVSMVKAMIPEELAKVKAVVTANGEKTETYDQAAGIFEKMALANEYPEFLTLPLYEAME